jgi:hypothetical protein
LQDATVGQIVNEFVEKFFGEDGFVDEDGTLPKPYLVRFIDTVLANAWNRLRKWVKSDKAKVEKQKTVVQEIWKGSSGYQHHYRLH